MCTRAICNDGTTSDARGHGACSWHGGVNQWGDRDTASNASLSESTEDAPSIGVDEGALWLAGVLTLATMSGLAVLWETKRRKKLKLAQGHAATEDAEAGQTHPPRMDSGCALGKDCLYLQGARYCPTCHRVNSD